MPPTSASCHLEIPSHLLSSCVSCFFNQPPLKYFKVYCEHYTVRFIFLMPGQVVWCSGGLTTWWPPDERMILSLSLSFWRFKVILLKTWSSTYYSRDVFFRARLRKHDASNHCYTRLLCGLHFSDYGLLHEWLLYTQLKNMLLAAWQIHTTCFVFYMCCAASWLLPFIKSDSCCDS